MNENRLVIQKDKLISLLKNMVSIKKIADLYNIDRHEVERIMLHYGISARKLRVNDNFFDVIDTEHKAYWLGYIAADGCINSNKHRHGVSITSMDYEHLEKWKICIGTKNKIRKTGKDGKYFQLEVSSANMVASLRKYGIIERKSLIIKFPDKDLIPQNLLHHFIRGFFDGDGSIFSRKDYCGRLHLNIAFCGTYDYMLNINTILGMNVKIYKRPSIYSITSQGNNICQKYLNYLYYNCSIYLDRKFNFYQNHLKYLSSEKERKYERARHCDI